MSNQILTESERTESGNKPKIKGRFYPLQHEEWVRACKELAPSERDVLYFIRTLDPHSNGMRIKAAEIARQLSTPERQVHRQTISRALKKLEAQGFISLELIEVEIRVNSRGYWCNETTPVCDDPPRCDETPQKITTHHNGSPHTNRPPEPLPAGNSTPSKILLDPIDSLSEAERENFEKFVKESWKATTGKEVGSIRSFLSDAEYQREWLEKWRASPAGKKSADEKAAVDWPQDPHFDEWLEKAYNIGVPWLNENPSETEERSRFLKWCIVGKGFETYAGRLENAS